MKKIIATFLFAFFQNLYGQVPYSFYGFYPVAQSHIFNPSAPVHERFTLGLVNTGLQLHNTPFRPMELFLKDANINQVLQNSINGMQQGDLLSLDARTDLVFLGIKLGKLYLTAGSYNQMNVHFGYPIDLFHLGYFGNAKYQNQTVNILGNSIEMLNYSAIHVGAQIQIKQLTIGGRVKMLNGIQSFKTDRTRAEIGFYDTAWTLNTDILIRSSANLADIGRELATVNNHLIPGSTGNNGFAFDLAAAWEISPKLRASALIADIGQITWNQHLKEYYSFGSAEFKGLNINLADDSQQDSFDEVIDSINSALNIQTRDGTPYSTVLPARISAIADYKIYKNQRITAFIDYRFTSDFDFFAMGAQYHIPLFTWFHLMGSFTISNKNFNNFGAGFAVKLAGIQIFALTDQFNSIINPEKLNSIGFRFGINYSLTNHDYFKSNTTATGKDKKDKKENTDNK